MQTPEQIADEVLERYNTKEYGSSLSLRDVLADALARYAAVARAAERAANATAGEAIDTISRILNSLSAEDRDMVMMTLYRHYGGAVHAYVAAAERARCALLADATASDYPADVFVSGAGAGARHAAECIAHAIRALE